MATVPARLRQVPVRQGCPQRLVKPHPSWLTQQRIYCRGASGHHEEPLLQGSKAVYFGKRSHATATQQAVEQILREAASTKFGTNFAQPLAMQSLDDVIAAVPLLSEDRERGRARTVVLKAEQVAPYLVQRKLVEGILYSIAHGLQVVTQSYVAIFVTQENGDTSFIHTAHPVGLERALLLLLVLHAFEPFSYSKSAMRHSFTLELFHLMSPCDCHKLQEHT